MRDTQLGDFLRARRARLTCAEVGLEERPLRRRVPGLRREEVARLAAISTDYYTRLEQGRIQPSPAVLASLAEALRLDEANTTYLHEISRLSGHVRAPQSPVPDPAQLRSVQTLIGDLRLSPAFAIGPRTEILAWNRLGAALITDFGAIAPAQRYYIHVLITDPAMRTLYDDWADVTRLAVEQMRALNAATPDDPQLTRLVRGLSAIDEDFRRWWASQGVAPRTSGVKVLHHPVVGELHLDWTALTWNAVPDWQIIAWQAPADTPTRRRLKLLAEHARQTAPDAQSLSKSNHIE